MRTHRPLAPMLALALSLAPLACEGGRDAAAARAPAATTRTPAPGSREALPPAAAAALDRANAEFRAGRYPAALAAYRDAARAAPAHAAPHYGIYMVARATRDSALADTALATVRRLAPAADALADTMITGSHGGAGARAPLPAGHPAVAPKPLPPGHPPTTTPRPAPKGVTTAAPHAGS